MTHVFVYKMRQPKLKTSEKEEENVKQLGFARALDMEMQPSV